jgi:hypothetical protein
MIFYVVCFLSEKKMNCVEVLGAHDYDDECIGSDLAKE